jgi:FkbM family methyltransferase
MFEDINLKKQHESVYKEIIEDNQYKIDIEDLRGKNVLDIGANNGVFTLLAKAYGAKKIVAVESNPEVFNLLENNIKGTDIIAINKAALPVSGEKVNIGRTEAYSNIDGRCYVVNDKDGNIETISLVDLFKNFDNDDIVLKMDCEGSEYEILMHSQMVDVKRFSTILIEMHENLGRIEGELYSIEELRDYLKSLRYTETWVCDYVEGVKLARYDLKLPKVTVVISEFLRPELLSKQIECFQNQTLKPEAILVWQTQVEGQKDAYKFENKWTNVHVIETSHDFNLPARFAMPLLAKTPYVCLCDDDIFPGPKWLEECYRISNEHNAVVSAYGIKYNSNICNDLQSSQYGDNGVHNEEPVKVDMGGHSWYCPTKFFTCFWFESVIDEKIADDIHFAYCLKKYLNVDIMVSSYPENNKDVWGSLDPDAGMGIKSLHARKFEDEKIWKDIKRRGWEQSELEYLKNNLNIFSNKRQEIVKKYKDLGWKI